MRRTVIVGLLALASWSAQAAHDVPGWRIGVAAAFSDFEWDSSPALIDDSAVGFKAYTQYQFNEWLGLEGAYHNTADFEEQARIDGENVELDLNFSGFSGHVVGYIPFGTPEIKLYAKIGYYDFDSDVTVNGVSDASGSEDGFSGGAGAMIEISDQLGLRADFDYFDAEAGDLWSVNLGIEYFFGGSGKKAD